MSELPKLQNDEQNMVRAFGSRDFAPDEIQDVANRFQRLSDPERVVFFNELYRATMTPEILTRSETGLARNIVQLQKTVGPLMKETIRRLRPDLADRKIIPAG